MRRLWRLLAPAAVSVVLTLSFLGWLQGASYDLEIGPDTLLGLGLHVLALQLAVSAFVIVSIDDATRGAGWTSRRSAGRHHGWFEIATRPVGLRAALTDFYSRPLLPVLLLALGCGLPLSAVVLGAMGDQGSESFLLMGLQASTSWSVAVAPVLVATVLLLHAGTARAALGLVWGSTLAFALGEVVFGFLIVDDAYYYDEEAPTWAGAGPATWLLSALVLSAVVLALAAVRGLRARADTADRREVRASAPVS